MRKLIALEIIIVLLTATIASASILTLYSAPITNQKTLGNGQMSFLYISLKAGQTVTGSFNFTGGDGTTGFQVYGPNGVTVVDSVTHAHKGDFVFVANVDGGYTFNVLYSDIENTNFVHYEYSVISPIMGLKPSIFAVLTIAVGIILIIIIAFLNFYFIRTKKKEKSLIP